MSDPHAYNLRAAADYLGVSTELLRRAIKSHGREGEPTPLPAKNLKGRAGYRIKRSALDDWFDSLPDA